MSQNVITETNLTNLDLANRGKVRDLYDLGEQLLIISTDRISAFDVVLPNGIPYKGQILTGLSEFWFDYTRSIVDNHIITTDVSQYPDVLQADAEVLKGRSMLVRKGESNRYRMRRARDTSRVPRGRSIKRMERYVGRSCRQG